MCVLSSPADFCFLNTSTGYTMPRPSFWHNTAGELLWFFTLTAASAVLPNTTLAEYTPDLISVHSVVQAVDVSWFAPCTIHIGTFISDLAWINTLSPTRTRRHWSGLSYVIDDIFLLPMYTAALAKFIQHWISARKSIPSSISVIRFALDEIHICTIFSGEIHRLVQPCYFTPVRRGSSSFNVTQTRTPESPNGDSVFMSCLGQN